MEEDMTLPAMFLQQTPSTPTAAPTSRPNGLAIHDHGATATPRRNGAGNGTSNSPGLIASLSASQHASRESDNPHDGAARSQKGPSDEVPEAVTVEELRQKLKGLMEITSAAVERLDNLVAEEFSEKENALLHYLVDGEQKVEARWAVFRDIAQRFAGPAGRLAGRRS